MIQRLADGFLAYRKINSAHCELSRYYDNRTGAAWRMLCTLEQALDYMRSMRTY